MVDEIDIVPEEGEGKRGDVMDTLGRDRPYADR